MNEWEKSKIAHNEAVAGCEAATLGLDTQVAKLVSQIAKIEKKHEADILSAEVAMQAAEMALKADAHAAWTSGNVFPAGKKRLPLDRGAWVQVAERIKREVRDPSAAARFIIEEGIEDTVIKSLTLVNDVVDAVLTLKKGGFPGVLVSKTASVSISLPKTKKEE